VLIFHPPFCIDRRLTPHPCCSNRLPVSSIDDITGCEYTRDAGHRVFVVQDVT
jgi:hypothetical protein